MQLAAVASLAGLDLAARRHLLGRDVLQLQADVTVVRQQRHGRRILNMKHINKIQLKVSALAVGSPGNLEPAQLRLTAAEKFRNTDLQHSVCQIRSYEPEHLFYMRIIYWTYTK